ncbi:MAG: hypothetical protein ACI861_002212 [Paracoccaceae bacterium]|jgi:hypothetical protein
MTSIVSKARKASRRHFRTLMAMLTVVISVVVVGNNLTFQSIRAPQNIGTAQMIYGWARLYKPMIYDEVRPKSISFGYSWVRDIFDPVKASDLTGEVFLNFGLSGATSFESYRLLQNALYVHKPDRIFLDMESFHDAPRASIVEHQFDERILYVNRDGSVNKTAKLNRIIKINTSGAALSFNVRFLETLYKINQGTPVEQLLPSYQRRDWRTESVAIASMKSWMEIGGNPRDQAGGPGGKFLSTFHDLEAAVRLACSEKVDVHIFESPYICGAGGKDTRSALTLMREISTACAAPITYHTFRYPNAVTMEGIIATPGPSTFYRPDGHPRPPLGQMMLTRILGLEDKDGAPPLPSDFGVDLMALDEAAANAWIDKRGERCNGNWSPEEYDAVVKEAEDLIPQWRDIFDEG